MDVEDWFHILGVSTEYSNPGTWKNATSCVVEDTKRLLELCRATNTHGTFLIVGWVADQFPDLVRMIAGEGHEIGCHTQWHRLVFELTPNEFEEDIAKCLDTLRKLSGQPVSCFRAPGFSITKDVFWAFPILRRHGIDTDISIVPAIRDHGGVPGFAKDPFILETVEGEIKCFPVSVMQFGGRTFPFSGGGYLRMFPVWTMKAGFRQNHRDGRSVQIYIHPREINPAQPRLKLPWAKYFKYYVNLRSTERKLLALLNNYRFTTVRDVMAAQKNLPVFRLSNKDEIKATSLQPPSSLSLKTSAR